MKRTTHEWGVRLREDFTGGVAGKPLQDMYIQADVSKRPGQGVDIRYFFSGTILQMPLRSGDVQIWLSAMRAIFEAAQGVGQGEKRCQERFPRIEERVSGKGP